MVADTHPRRAQSEMNPSAARAFSHMTVHAVALASSSTSLGMAVSPPPGVIEAIDNRIRECLQRTSNDFFAGVITFSIAVVIGVALEGPELLHEMWPRLFTCFTGESVSHLRKFKRLVIKIGFWGWLLVVVGIVGESVFEALQNRAEGQLQTFNDILLADAQRNAGGARASALVAANAASIAVSESDAATASSANAMALARGARKEADSFEREIKSANSTAIAAERHLKDALNDAAEAQAELNRIRTPRSLVNEDGLIAALAKFGGTEYAFSMCFADDESISLLKQIDSALQAAGWKRVAPSPTPAIGLKIFGDKSEDMIAEGTLT